MEVQNHHEEAVEGDDDDDMPIPLNSAYTHHHHHHMIHDPPISSSTIDDHPFKKAIRYRECLKNHAASMGGTATDGCGEFMASGDEGTLEALTCSVCNCHRNFHRKEVEGEDMNNNNNNNNNCINPRRNPLFLTHHNHNSYHRHPGGALIPSRPIPHHQMLMSYTGIGAASESDEQEDHHLHHHHHQGNGMNIMRSQLPHQNMVKKRFRTKFTQEQKEKMLNFAEKVGWKIQKQEESVVQQFCQEVGVKRRVLKVWMHNNKHNLAKKNLQTNVNPPQEQL